ncbi:DNA-invertase [Neoasaia chiangmaiensis NBRC 101099]|uniref:Resolvase n=2 Tax=Neoasaia chiangmaiensis TaxID=320497 RepID=A0A1U9KNT0_9PROT|nr:recombinase family protein [Neoasaia chiangmaiensis]AQS87471.1 resolvase [Neoasaia chiangmaiensis]GBR42593.1 DNA-invertase [Neoasaia chiangmaiensis NBRC 101099]GEN16259.1 invertase [Neoasaia chiangmaiensis]
MGRYGYARVSTTRQQTDNQVTDLTREGVPEGGIVTETISGATAWKSRPELRKLVRRLQAGDSLTVVKLDRLGRNALDVLTLIDLLKKRGISVRILNLGIDTSGAGGRLFLLLLAGFAEFERNIIRERVLSGLETAKAKGTRLGRKPALPDDAIAQARRLKAQGLSAREVGKLLHVSKMTAWRAMNS